MIQVHRRLPRARRSRPVTIMKKILNNWGGQIGERERNGATVA
jgi:hypothetical protein